MCNNNRVTKPCEGKYCKLKYGATRILEDVHPRRRFCNYCQRMKEQEKKRELREATKIKHYPLKPKQLSRKIPVKINTGAKEAAHLRKCRRISAVNNQMGG